MTQDYKLGLRMLVRFPGLTIAGGLALAIAIGVGAGWYDLWHDLLTPTIPLPDGDRIVLIETQNVRTGEPELRVVHDFLEWRRELRTLEGLGAYHPARRNLVIDGQPAMSIPSVELTAAAFRAARVPPTLGRGLVEADEIPGAPAVLVIGYALWQRAFEGRQDVVGSVVRLGDAAAIVVGVMPDGFTYPVNQVAWTPLQLRASYGPLEGGPITVIGRLAPGVTRAQADAEVRAVGQRAAAAYPPTHEHLRPRVIPPGPFQDVSQVQRLAISNGPVLLVLLIACLNVGTLVYARTATRETEIALRSALGASRARIVSQLFVEALVLAGVATAVGLLAADWTLRWGIDRVTATRGGPPFWMTPGLEPTTILYAAGLAVVSSAMLSLLPALKATSTRVQSHLANLGTGGSTLRFGRVWTTAMIAQVAITVIAIPVAGESVHQMMRKAGMRAEFPSRDYFSARIDLDQPFADAATPAFAERRARAFAELQRRVAGEPGVIAVTFASGAPGGVPSVRSADVEGAPGGGAAYDDLLWTTAVGPDYFEVFDRAIVAGRNFDGRDRTATARTVIVNQAFARRFSRHGGGSPIGARVRYGTANASAEPWFEIVGIVRDLGLNPEDRGPCCEEAPFVYHAAAAETVEPFVLTVRVRGNPAPLAARLSRLAAGVNSGLRVEESRPLVEWIANRNEANSVLIGAQAGVTILALFLSTLGIFSLMSVSVSRRTREIGVRTALGASPRHVLAGIASRAAVLMGSGVAAGGILLMLGVLAGDDDVTLFVGWVAITSLIMMVAGVVACLGPARRALKINPTDALREA